MHLLSIRIVATLLAVPALLWGASQVQAQEETRYGPDIVFEPDSDPTTGENLSHVIAGDYDDVIGPSWTCWWHDHLDAAIDVRNISTGIPDRIMTGTGEPKLAWRFDDGKLQGPVELRMEMKGVTYYLPNEYRMEFTNGATEADSLLIRLYTPGGEPVETATFDLSGLADALEKLPCIEAGGLSAAGTPARSQNGT